MNLCSQKLNKLADLISDLEKIDQRWTEDHFLQ